MQDSDVPYKFTYPFAAGATPGYINTIPPTATGGAASQLLGFPPLTDTPIAAGGVPPAIGDMNGLPNYLSLWARWVQAGAPVAYDSGFQTAIGGYPAGARVFSSATKGVIWQSNVDNNTTNPDMGGAGWTACEFVDNGNNALIVTASSLSATGANMLIQGDGTITPNKTLRVHSGVLSLLNNAGTPILSLDDTGDINCAGQATVAAATASGAAVNLGQFPTGGSGSGQYQELPNGTILQWLAPIVIAAGSSSGTISWPIAFPTALSFVNPGMVPTGSNFSIPAVSISATTSGIDISLAGGAGTWQFNVFAIGN